MDVDSSPGNISFNASSSKSVSKTSIDCASQCTLLKPKEVKYIKMKRQVKTLKQKIKRKDLKISNMKEIITELKQKGYSNNNLEMVLRNYFEG